MRLSFSRKHIDVLLLLIESEIEDCNLDKKNTGYLYVQKLLKVKQYLLDYRFDLWQVSHKETFLVNKKEGW